MSDTLTINVVDISVPATNRSIIPIIKQPNPVTNFSATYYQIKMLLNFPKYTITESATGTVVNGHNIYDYFPDEDPSGGGGGGGGGGGTTEKNGFVTAGMSNVISGASTKQVKTGVFEFEPIN